MKSVAIIIPVLNEAADIDANLSVILAHIGQADSTIQFTVIVVDDGSTDQTADLVLKRGQRDHNIRLLSLSRHCGKEAAILAGLCNAERFDAAIVMDSDLQHPPALLAEMIARWQQGYLVVEAVKASRGHEPIVKNLLVRSYYRLFNFLTTLSISGDTDFKLLDKRVIEVYCGLSERNRFFRGLVKWMNFPTARISFDVPESVRARSSWGNMALFRYAVSSITSFTAFPLQIVTLLGALIFVISLLVGSMALFDKLVGNAVDGFTTVILLILLIGSILMFSVGMIGIYVGKIYDEVKKRPAYLLDKNKSNLDERL
jgi:dolichol-phosphate mannosyltransferase